MKNRIGQKATKTGVLLAGLRDPRVAAQLATYGFNPEVLDEGWLLYMDVASRRLDRVFSKPVKKSSVVAQLNQFEDHWFRVIETVLGRAYPDIGMELFKNLERGEGREAAFGVAHFIERLKAMENGEEPYGAKGQEVRAYLRKRGLTDEIIDKVSEALGRLRDVQETKAAVVPFDEAGFQAAESKMWAWYLEWSQLSRHIIRDGNLLRALGFKKRRTPRRKANVAVVVTSETASSVVEADATKALPPKAAANENGAAA